MAYCVAKRPFSILYQRVLHYSSSSFKTEDLHKPFPKFLFAECGFTESEYKTLEKRFRTLTSSKCIETFSKSVHFFRDFGFSEEQIKKIIINDPSVIAKNAEKTLSPKLECLKKIGLSQQKIAQMTSLNPRFLNCSLQDKMIPNIQLLEKVYNNNDDLCRALQVTPSILYKDFNVLQSLRLLKEAGIEGDHLRILIKRRPVVLTLSPEILTEKMVFVKTLGISVPSKTFVRAVEVLSHCTMETVAAKIALLGSLGFQAEEIQRMLVHLQVRRRAGPGHILQCNIAVRKRLIWGQIRDAVLRLSAEDWRGFATYFTALIDQQSCDYCILKKRNAELRMRLAELDAENARLTRDLRVRDIMSRNPERH